MALLSQPWGREEELTWAVGRCGNNGLLGLRICFLRLVYELLLPFVLVLARLGFLCGGDGSLVVESGKDAESEERPSGDLHSPNVSICMVRTAAEKSRLLSDVLDPGRRAPLDPVSTSVVGRSDRGSEDGWMMTALLLS